MTLIGDRVETVLEEDAAVSAVVSSRIYPGSLPQRATLPAIVYVILGGGRVHSLDGDTGIGNPTVQVDAYAGTIAVAAALQKLVRVALDGATTFRALASEPQEIPDPDANRWRVTADYTLMYEDD